MAYLVEKQATGDLMGTGMSWFPLMVIATYGIPILGVYFIIKAFRSK